MALFDEVTVTAVEEHYTVHFPKDRVVRMKDRPSFGLSLCVSGQLTYTMGEQKIVSDPDHAILLPLGGNYRIHGDKEGVFPVINFQCTGLSCDRILAIPLANPQSCLRDCETLQRLLRLGGSRMQIFSAFYGLLEKVAAGEERGADPLAKVICHMEENLADPGLSNSVLAQRSHISESYLRKLFYRQYHTTPKQYILELRLQKAKLLLTDTASSVTEVAEACGFSSVYHFCKVFKVRTGTTPTQYAATHRRQKI